MEVEQLVEKLSSPPSALCISDRDVNFLPLLFRFAIPPLWDRFEFAEPNG